MGALVVTKSVVVESELGFWAYFTFLRYMSTRQGRAGEGWAGQGRAGQGWAGQGWAGLGRAGLGGGGRGRAGEAGCFTRFNVRT